MTNLTEAEEESLPPERANLIRAVRERNERDVPTSQKVDFVAQKQAPQKSTTTSTSQSTRTSSSSLSARVKKVIWSVSRLESSYARECDKASSPRSVHRKLMQRIRKDNIAVATDTSYGNPKSYTTRCHVPIKKFLREYGKIHAVYARDGLKTFQIKSFVYAEPLAEKHADLLVRKNRFSAAIVTSVYGMNNGLQKEYTRNELDERGHHYVAK